MRDLYFLDITIQNFKSFSDKVTIKLDNPGVTYLTGDNLEYPRFGSNGCGKTTIWEALTWCLKGRTLSGQYGADVRRRDTEGTTRVQIELDADGLPHTIERTLAPDRLCLDGEIVGQDEIDRLIPLPLHLIGYTMIFGEGKDDDRKGMFFDLAPQKKMDLFSEVLGLDRWSERAAAALKSAQTIEKQLDRLDRDLKNMDDNLAQTKVWISLAEKQVLEWDQEHKHQLAELETSIKDMRARRDELQNEHAAIDLKHDSLATECKALEKELQTLRDNLSAAREEGLPCPECGQKTVDQHKVAKAENAYNKAFDHFMKYKEQADDYSEKLRISGPKIAQLDGQLRVLEDSVKDFNSNPYREKLREHKERKRKLLDQIEDAEADLRKAEKRHEKLKYWGSTGFKLIKLYLVEELLQELQLMTIVLLEELGLVGWKINFVIERETKAGTIQQGLTVEIAQPKSKPVKWKTFSGGEGQRLRLVGSIALAFVLLNRAGIKTNLLVLDEPTQRLSSVGIDDLCATLADYANKTGLSVWIIDHHSIESPHFTTTLTVVKDSQGAWIE